MSNLVDEINDKSAIECVIRLVDKATEFSESEDWDELAEMLADQVLSDSEPSVMQYQYLLRLNLRFRDAGKKQFNIVTGDEDRIRIENYDYKTFKWAVENKLDEELDNRFIYINKGQIPDTLYNGLLSKIA